MTRESAASMWPRLACVSLPLLELASGANDLRLALSDLKFSLPEATLPRFTMYDARIMPPCCGVTARGGRQP